MGFGKGNGVLSFFFSPSSGEAIKGCGAKTCAALHTGTEENFY